MAIDSVVEKLLTSNGKYSFELHTANFNECIDALIRDYADIAFVGKVAHIKNIKFSPFYKEDICLVAKEGHFDKKRLKIKDLNPSNAVIAPYSDDFMSWFSHTFDQRKPLIQCDLNSELERFIISKNLWSFVPISLAKDFEKNNICIYSFSEKIPKRVIYYALKQSTDDAGVLELLNEIRNELGKFEHIVVYEE